MPRGPAGLAPRGPEPAEANGKAEPAAPGPSQPSGIDAEDARSLRKGALFFVGAIGFVVLLKLLLGW